MNHEVKVETKTGPKSGDKPRNRWACSCSPTARGEWTTDASRAQGGGTKHVTWATKHAVAQVSLPLQLPADIAVEEHW